MAKRSADGSVQFRQVAPVILMIFANFFGQNIIFPFLPFMVKDFLDVSRNEVGFYSGFLASAYHLGAFIGSLMWGAAADRFGRRPALLASQSLTMIWMLMFGFSRSFAWAVLVRCLWGLSSGIAGVGKTVLSESATSKATARTFALMGVAGGFGRLLGPATGGLLVGLIADFPYVLPSLVCFFVSGVSLILSLFFLKETLVKRSTKASKPLPGRQSPGNTECHEQVELLPASTPDVAPTTNGSVTQNGHVDVSYSSPARRQKSRWSHWTYAPRCCPCHVSVTPAPYQRMDESTNSNGGCGSCCRRVGNTLRDYGLLLKDRVIRSACIVYTLLALTAIMHNQLIPLLLVVNFAHGGLCMNSAEIGIVLAVVGIFQLLMQLLLYPRLAKCFGYRRVFRGGMIGLAFFLILLPWLPKFTGNQDPVRDVLQTPLASNASDFSPTRPSWLNSSKQPTPFATESSTFLGNTSDFDLSNVTTDSYEQETHIQPTLNTSVSSDVCLASKGVVGNDTDECGRPLAQSGKSRMVNFNLIACLAWYVWLIVFVVAGGGYLTRTVSFTSVNILINNSCEMEVRARVNGIGMAMSAVGRLVGPIIVSNIFAVSDTNAPHSTFTVWHHTTAWMTALFALVAALWSLKLPASIEKKKIAISAEPNPANTPSPADTLLPVDEESELADVEDEIKDVHPSGEESALVLHQNTSKNEHESAV